MADIDIPFNFDPVDNKETTASYTVPAGSYAIITATLSVTAVSGFSSGTNGTSDSLNMPVESSGSESVSVELRLKAGEVLTKTETPASGSTTTGTNASGFFTHKATSLAELLVNGTAVSRIKAVGHCTFFDADASAATSHTTNQSGTADVTWHIAEYNSIT